MDTALTRMPRIIIDRKRESIVRLKDMNFWYSFASMVLSRMPLSPLSKRDIMLFYMSVVEEYSCWLVKGGVPIIKSGGRMMKF